MKYSFEHKCGKIYNVSEQHAGKQFICKGCQELITIPNPPSNNTESDIKIESTQIKQSNTNNVGKICINIPTNQIVNSTKAIFNDLAEINFKQEIVPIDESNFKVLLNDFAFWAALFMGIVPILILTTNDANFQQTAFALFFATIWGVIFKKFIVDVHSSWKAPIVSFLFTGMIGIPILLFIYQWLPSIYMKLSYSNDLLLKLIGYIFQVGMCEELIKILPVFIYVFIRKSNIEPMQILIIGLFSGLGFAAFENVIYNMKFINTSAYLANQYGAEGAALGTHQAMVTSISRYLSTVFGHAIYSGIFSYFIATIFISGKRKAALFILGITLSASVHGLYDWLVLLQPTFAGLTNAVAFILFYGYILKLRGMIEIAKMSEMPSNN